MKQMDVISKKIGDNTFYIKPFSAFVSANISGELANIALPLLSALAPVASSVEMKDGAFDIGNVNIEDAVPSITSAFSSISGDKLECLMKKLLINHSNISIEGEITGGAVKVLTYDLANEVFCAEIDEMYILCFEVIRLNFGGFFKKLGARFGAQLTNILQQKAPSSKNTESST